MAASMSKVISGLVMCHSFRCDDSSEMTQNFEHYRVWPVEPPGDYLWSSFRYYVRDSKSATWLKMGFVLGYFGAKETEA
jgi:hypothetical protein